MVRGRKNPLHYGLVARLKKARKQAGHSRRGLTAQSEVLDTNTVHALEQGQRIPRLDTIEKIAYALGRSPAYLAYGLDGECTRGEALRAAGVGARLRQTRLERGLSALALAQLAGTSHTAVGNIEKGGTIPTVATSEALAHALGVSPGWLAYGIEPKELAARRRGRPAASLPDLAG